MYNLDFMAIGAHADDLEMGMGGTLAKMAQNAQGLMVDMTVASAASRGTPAQRLAEAQVAAQILGLDRVNLGLEDAHLSEHHAHAVELLVQLIRTHRPRVLFAPVASDYHPDHNQCHLIVKEAWYKAGLGALWPSLPKYRPERVFYYPGALYPQESPSFLVNVDDYWELRQRSLESYHSQFDRVGEQNRPQTAVSSTAFQASVVHRHLHFGTLARCQYAEAFWSDLSPVIDTPLHIQGATYG